MTTRTMALAVLLTGVSLGCADGTGTAIDGDGGVVTGGPITAQTFVSGYCNLLKPCCMKAGLRADGVQCNRLYSSVLTPATYNGAAAGTCLAEMQAAANNPAFCDNPEGTSDICNQVAVSTGTKKPGDTCSQDEDCASSTAGKVRCQTEFVNNAEIRKCQIQLRGKDGDGPCAGTVDGNVTSYSFGGTVTDVPAQAYLCLVSDGLRCDSSSRMCVKIPPVGGACVGSGSYACVDTAYCDSETKVCVARKAVAAPCRRFADECIDTSHCDEKTLVCTARVADGAACVADAECLSNSCVNMTCEKNGLDTFVLTFICGA